MRTVQIIYRVTLGNFLALLAFLGFDASWGGNHPMPWWIMGTVWGGCVLITLTIKPKWYSRAWLGR
jgi:hypothetical protein